MSLLRLAFIRQPPQTIRILPTIRQCALRPTLRKSLQNQQCSLRRLFASAPPPPTTGPRAVTTPPNPNSAGAGGSAGPRAGNPRKQLTHPCFIQFTVSGVWTNRLTTTSPELPERLLIYHAGTGRTAFLAFWKITTVFSCVFFCFVAAPSYVRAEDKTLTEAAGCKLFTPLSHMLTAIQSHHSLSSSSSSSSCPLPHVPSLCYTKS